jgi:hypothetical protein
MRPSHHSTPPLRPPACLATTPLLPPLPPQINVGIKGVPPGFETVRHLRSKVMQAKFWGGLALGSLAVGAHMFDGLCAAWLGTSLATTSLIIIVGAVLQVGHQLAGGSRVWGAEACGCWAACG